jgi:hypothetical protein
VGGTSACIDGHHALRRCPSACEMYVTGNNDTTRTFCIALQRYPTRQHTACRGDQNPAPCPTCSAPRSSQPIHTLSLSLPHPSPPPAPGRGRPGMKVSPAPDERRGDRGVGCAICDRYALQCLTAPTTPCVPTVRYARRAPLAVVAVDGQVR